MGSQGEPIFKFPSLQHHEDCGPLCFVAPRCKELRLLQVPSPGPAPPSRHRIAVRYEGVKSWSGLQMLTMRRPPSGELGMQMNLWGSGVRGPTTLCSKYESIYMQPQAVPQMQLAYAMALTHEGAHRYNISCSTPPCIGSGYHMTDD